MKKVSLVKAPIEKYEKVQLDRLEYSFKTAKNESFFASLLRVRKMEGFHQKTGELSSSIENILCIQPYKPHMKIIYSATVQKTAAVITISITAIARKSLFERASEALTDSLSPKSISKYISASFLAELRSYFNGIYRTDVIISKLNINATKDNPSPFSSIAKLPLCLYHKWLDIMSFDILYKVKLKKQAELDYCKSRRSMEAMTDFILLEKCINAICKEYNMIKVENSTYMYYKAIFDSTNSGFVLVKPLFYLTNAATIYVMFYEINSLSFRKQILEEIIALANKNSKRVKIFRRPLHYIIVENNAQKSYIFLCYMKIR